MFIGQYSTLFIYNIGLSGALIKIPGSKKNKFYDPRYDQLRVWNLICGAEDEQEQSKAQSRKLLFSEKITEDQGSTPQKASESQ
jgi:hypothetical protein